MSASPAQMGLLIAGPAVRAAARIRRHFLQRGYTLMADGAAPRADTVELQLSARGPRATWCTIAPADAAPDRFGALLSEGLRCQVVTVLRCAPLCVYEVCVQGRVEEKLAVRGEEVVEDVGSRFTTELSGEKPLAELLEAAGLSHFDAPPPARTMTLRFAPRHRADVDVIEVDPTLSCPICGEAMRARDGRHGRFFGCIRFPDCRGKLTEKQAETSRSEAR